MWNLYKREKDTVQSASSGVSGGGGLRVLWVLRDNCIEPKSSSAGCGFITGVGMAELVMYRGYEGVKKPRATTPNLYERRHRLRANLNRTIYRVICAYRKTKVDFCTSAIALNAQKQPKYLKNNPYFG